MNQLTKFFLTLTFAVGLSPALGLGSEAGADEPGKSASTSSKTITIQIQSTSEDQKKILDQVRKSLKSSGMDDEASKEILEKLNTQLGEMVVSESSNQTGSSGKNSDKETEDSLRSVEQRDVVALGQALFLDINGKQHRLELKPQIVPGFNEARQALRMQEGAIESVKKLMDAELKKSMQAEVVEFAIGIGVAYVDDADGSKGNNEQEDALEKSDSVEEASSESKTGSLAVQSVFDDTPAAAAGLKPGDRLKTIDGKKIAEATQLQELVQEAGKAGKEVELTWERDGKAMEAKLMPQKVPSASSLYGMAMGGYGTGGPTGIAFSGPLDPKALGQNSARIFVTPSQQIAIADAGGNDDQLRKEVTELKEKLSAVENDLREIKEILSAKDNSAKDSEDR